MTVTVPVRHGLVLRPGQRSPRKLLMLDERTAFLREAAKFFPDASDREIADTIHAELGRYRASAWQHERAQLTCPRRHAGRIRAFYWLLLKTVDAVPGERTIRRAIGGFRGPPNTLECGSNSRRR